MQAVGRVRRLGNPYPVVYVWEYCVPDSFNDRLIQLNLKKALPGIMAELIRQLFHSKGEEDDESMDLGDWIAYNGKLTAADAPEVQALHLPLLKVEKL